MAEAPIWPLTPHTGAKHVILKRHLDAWLPIMTQFNKQLLFIDGFAGPGRYEGGDPGSPIIALRAAVLNKRFLAHPPTCKVLFRFIEKDPTRVASLRHELLAFEAEYPLPSWVSYKVVHEEFAEYMQAALDSAAAKKQRLPSIFAFIDPFGYSGLPMSLISRIQRVPRSECLINFASKAIIQWVAENAERLAHVDELFGSPDWRTHRYDEHALASFYGGQLRACAGFKYVRNFQMKSANDATVYFLAFATSNEKGLSVFKGAAWKADPHSGQVFSDASDPNQLFLVEPLPPLRDLLTKEFSGRGWVGIKTVGTWVLLYTDYSEVKHLKTLTLKELEVARPKLLEVRRPVGKRQRPGDYPDGTMLRFQNLSY